jgi:hypothetical protein
MPIGVKKKTRDQFSGFHAVGIRAVRKPGACHWGPRATVSSNRVEWHDAGAKAAI